MDWFERITGFRERSYEETRERLAVDGQRLRSLVNDKSYGVGEFELVSLRSLRERVRSSATAPGRLKIAVQRGDVRELHQSAKFEGALFQVASQFNMLEMVGPAVTPEDGVTRYQYDRTQGPACAISAGAATIFRNYFVPLSEGIGQTRTRQIDGLAGIGDLLSAALGKPVDSLWEMRNGYALCTSSGLAAITDYVRKANAEAIDALRDALHIGLQWDVEVTGGRRSPGPHVSQAFCSALPISYTGIPASYWRPFASLILEAAYEATVWGAVLNARRGASNILLLTSLGGGAFGNDSDWIVEAKRRALALACLFDLDVRLVSYSAPSRSLIDLVESVNSGAELPK